MVTGWVKWTSDGTRSYFGSNGAALSGWQTIGGKKYYFDPKNNYHGARWSRTIDGNRYYFNGSCQMHTGWLKWNGQQKWSYFGSDGTMLVGSHKINGRTIVFDSSGKVDAQIKLNVPCFLQYPELPTGCEAVALTNALMYKGFRLSKTELADKWISRSTSDFVMHFWGNPHSVKGNSIAAPGLMAAANKYLQAKGSKLHAYDVSGKSLDNLFSYVSNGNPVIVWSTINQQRIGLCYGTQWYNGKKYSVYTNSHTIVLRGFDLVNNKVYLSDSISGYVTCDASWFAMTYTARGSQAIVIK